jgi:hypothetical protein
LVVTLASGAAFRQAATFLACAYLVKVTGDRREENMTWSLGPPRVGDLLRLMGVPSMGGEVDW